MHIEQVEAGLIPQDSPPMFVRPEGEDALVDGLPWWFGGLEHYRPTPEAIAEFSKPIPHQAPDVAVQTDSEA